MKIYGYEIDNWIDMYRIYVFENKKEPETLMDIKRHWLNKGVRTPKQCIDVTSVMAEAEAGDINEDVVVKMLDRFQTLTGDK